MAVAFEIEVVTVRCQQLQCIVFQDIYAAHGGYGPALDFDDGHSRSRMWFDENSSGAPGTARWFSVPA
jgi:hypothetical protein